MNVSRWVTEYASLNLAPCLTCTISWPRRTRRRSRRMCVSTFVCLRGRRTGHRGTSGPTRASTGQCGRGQFPVFASPLFCLPSATIDRLLRMRLLCVVAAKSFNHTRNSEHDEEVSDSTFKIRPLQIRRRSNPEAGAIGGRFTYGRKRSPGRADPL
jgi:hypothetical protein